MVASLLERTDESSQRLRIAHIDEVDRYGGAIAGVTVESVRTSQGSRPTVVSAFEDGLLAVNSVSAGFSAIGFSTIPSDVAVAIAFHEAPPGTRWCGVDIAPGTVVTYGPGVEHIGLNPEGVIFSFVVAPHHSVDAMGSWYDAPVCSPGPGQMQVYGPGVSMRGFGEALSALRRRALLGMSPSQQVLGDIERTFATVLSRADGSASAAPPGRIDDRKVVASSLAYADSLGRVPTVSEIHSAVFVSERRLRYAFERVLGQSPSSALRSWALDRARRELLAADPEVDTVLGIATRLGFANQGRFAARYRAVFGELPSETLCIRGVMSGSRQPAASRVPGPMGNAGSG